MACPNPGVPDRIRHDSLYALDQILSDNGGNRGEPGHRADARTRARTAAGIPTTGR